MARGNRIVTFFDLIVHSHSRFTTPSFFASQAPGSATVAAPTFGSFAPAFGSPSAAPTATPFGGFGVVAAAAAPAASPFMFGSAPHAATERRFEVGSRVRVLREIAAGTRRVCYDACIFGTLSFASFSSSCTFLLHTHAGFQFGNGVNMAIPAGTIGTVLRTDSDGDIYINFGAALNPDRFIPRRMFDQIEAVADAAPAFGSAVSGFGSPAAATAAAAAARPSGFFGSAAPAAGFAGQPQPGTSPGGFGGFGAAQPRPFGAPAGATTGFVGGGFGGFGTAQPRPFGVQAPMFGFGSAPRPAGGPGGAFAFGGGNPSNVTRAPTFASGASSGNNSSSTSTAHMYRVDASTSLLVRRGPAASADPSSHIGLLAPNSSHLILRVEGEFAKLSPLSLGENLRGTQYFNPAHDPATEGWVRAMTGAAIHLHPASFGAPTIVALRAQQATTESATSGAGPRFPIGSRVRVVRELAPGLVQRRFLFVP